MDLALKGRPFVHPNPMVGAVVVYQGRIIGEGYHTAFGQPHAEVEAINSVQDKELLKDSTIYVNLEPCAHYGKTPPCANLIVASGIPKVVVSNLDPHDKVAGQGIRILQDAGIEVTTGVLKAAGERLNAAFFTYHSCGRPYVVLKWAQTQDGFIGRLPDDQQSNKISGPMVDRFTHRLRSYSDAILIGSNTAITDNPKLTTRHVPGPNPLRVVIDRYGKTPSSHQLFTDGLPSLVFGKKRNLNATFIELQDYRISNILDELHKRQIAQLVVEGGSQTLQRFIDQHLWDECQIVESKDKIWLQGIKAPERPSADQMTTVDFKEDTLTTLINKPCFSF